MISAIYDDKSMYLTRVILHISSSFFFKMNFF